MADERAEILFRLVRQAPHHVGRIAMREQVTLIGDRLDMCIAPGRGAAIRIEFSA